MMHNDEPTLIDVLDRMSLIEEIGQAIVNCSPPQVFGIHGDWGLGKTSFLHQVQLYLTAECPQQSEEEIRKANMQAKTDYKRAVQAVWFDAWRYQHEDAPVVALLQEMRSQLSWSCHRIRSAERNTEIVLRGALLSIEELTKKIGFQYSKFRDANREWEEKNLAISLPSHTLREHLREAIGKLLPKSRPKDAVQPRVVVFIDDIDRCEPEVAYRLLEGLKIYLTLDNCVFVLGMNQKSVEDAISSQMGALHVETSSGTSSDTGRIRLRASAYMEKLCQNVWQLPAVRNPAQVLLHMLETTVDRQDIRELISRALEGTSCLPSNPRRLKGLSNLIGRLVVRLPQDIDTNDEAMTIEAQMLLIVAYIYQFHPDLYVRWEAELEFYDKILDWCLGREPNIPILEFLVLPNRIVQEDRAATPSTERESTYPDPTETGVFWIQSLILSLGNELAPEQFAPYLYGRKT